MIKIIRISRSSINIEYCGREVRILGDLCDNGFRAFANTMKWMLPQARQEPVTKLEKYKIMKTVALHCQEQKDYIFFVDDKGDELKLNEIEDCDTDDQFYR